MKSWCNNPMCKDDDWTYADSFDTREEAVQDGIEQYKEALDGNSTKLFDLDYPDAPSGRFQIGYVKPYTPIIDVENIIERLQQQASDECGEYGWDFLNWTEITRPIEEDLRENLQRELDAWLKRYHLEPTFFTVENVENIDARDYL